MTLPLHPLDQQLFTRAQALLDDEWITHDPDLAPVLPTVLARNVGQDWHKAGTFRHHLVGVARSLTLWQRPRDVRLLGLLHSVYGNAFVDLVKFDPASERARLRDLVGEPAEHLVYLFCTQSRTQFVQRVLGGALEADGSLVLDKDGQRHLLTPYEVAAFVIVSMADTLVAMDSGRVVASGPLAQTLARIDLPIRLGEDAGTVLDGRVGEVDHAWHLARVDFSGGSLWVRDQGLPVGRPVRVRVLARDVSLAEEPGTSSIQNVLRGCVDAVGDDGHPGLALVRVRVGDAMLLARLTKRSAALLGVVPGRTLWVQMKSVALME